MFTVATDGGGDIDLTKGPLFFFGSGLEDLHIVIDEQILNPWDVRIPFKIGYYPIIFGCS